MNTINDSFPIRRAWNPTCPEGKLRDRFANAVAHRILSSEEAHDSAVAGYPAVLADDFVERCDQLFAEHSPETTEAAELIAESINTADLFDYSCD